MKTTKPMSNTEENKCWNCKDMELDSTRLKDLPYGDDGRCVTIWIKFCPKCGTIQEIDN